MFKHRFVLGNFLLGSVKRTKNADLGEYKYIGYGIGFDSCSVFLFTDERKCHYFWNRYELICAFW